MTILEWTFDSSVEHEITEKLTKQNWDIEIKY